LYIYPNIFIGIFHYYEGVGSLLKNGNRDPLQQQRRVL